MPSFALLKLARKLHAHFIVSVLFYCDNSDERMRVMVWIKYNPNPVGRRVGDCAVRAIAKALRIDWESAYLALAMNGYSMGDMPSSDSVWGATLRQNGFYRYSIPNSCPDCYTAEDFCRDHPRGTFVLGFGGHVATVHDGLLFDSYDSSQEVPQFYWTDYKED